MKTTPGVILHMDYPEAAIGVVKEQHADLTIHPCTNHAELSGLIAETGAEVVYTLRFKAEAVFPRKALIESASVKWVSVAGSGTDHLQPWNPDRVKVTNSAGVAADMMAEYAMAGMLHFSLNLDRFRQGQQRRKWISGKVAPVQGKTVLIIGLGPTGQAVARKCKLFNLATLGVRARPRQTQSVDRVYGVDALPELWARADFIVLCVPRLESTFKLVNSSAFDAMKPDAVLIDVSRGGVTDESALVSALDTGRIRGAVLDVFETEPLPQDNPLWRYENVILTPHCSSVYDGWLEKSAQMFSENLSRYRGGEPLMNEVDPARGY